MPTRKRLGIATAIVFALAVLSGAQDISFVQKMLVDIGVSGLVAFLLPKALGPVLTGLFILLLLIWVFEPQIEFSDAWLSRKRLRATVFLLAKKMRDFAQATEREYESGKRDRQQDELLKRFFDKFPFASYSALEDRMQAKIYTGGVRPHVSKFMPSTTGDIRNIAETLERQALDIPGDMLL